MKTSHLFCTITLVAAWFLSSACSRHTVTLSQEREPPIPDAAVANPPLRGFERIEPEPLLGEVDPTIAPPRLQERRLNREQTITAGLRDVYFAYDSAAINEDGMSALEADAEWLHAHSNTRLRIEGHCDERGSAAYNLVLGEKRALAVRQYLVELGIPSQRVTAVSYGEERPACNDHTEACYQINRRGHLVVTR
jgi:peptidoglycan-associated lipoprotein